jgi:hypothetical protein
VSEILQVRKDKVLEAADKCETAREILRVLFPEVLDRTEWKDVTEHLRVGSYYDREPVLYLASEYFELVGCRIGNATWIVMGLDDGKLLEPPAGAEYRFHNGLFEIRRGR